MLHSRSLQLHKELILWPCFQFCSPFNLCLFLIAIRVGFVQWKNYKRKPSKELRLVARKQVGQKMTISITVDKDSKAETDVEKAVEAFKRINTTLESIKTFHLLNPDLKTEVKFLTGSQEPFTL